MSASREEIVALLQQAYCMELETVMNYLANSINLDGVRAEEIKRSLAADITGEIAHAQQLGNRIKQLEGRVPGSESVRLDGQRQPPEDTTDVVDVIEGVIEAEQAACDHYNKIIRATDGSDFVTQDLCIRLLADEEEHLIEFKGFLKEYQRRDELRPSTGEFSTASPR
jgi:bacterioferritin